MKAFLAASALAIGTLISVAVYADSWMPPETKTYLSGDATYRFTVVPKSVYSRTQKDPSGHRSFCEGTLERREGDGYRQVWRNPLVNDEAPVDALVAGDTGYVVTFDNWGSMGYGDDVVAIYGPSGTRIRKLALKDFLDAEDIEALPRSVSSIWWRGASRRLLLIMALNQSPSTARGSC